MTGALLVALAGGAGAAARFWVDGTIRARGRTVLPVATVTVNVTGSFLIGLVAGAHVYLGLPATWQLLLATGFCGGTRRSPRPRSRRCGSCRRVSGAGRWPTCSARPC